MSLSLINSYVLQYLWGMVNAAQVIVFSSIYRLRFPENVKEVTERIWKILTLDIFNTQELLELIFDFRETEAFVTEYDEDGMSESVFADAGFETSNFV